MTAVTAPTHVPIVVNHMLPAQLTRLKKIKDLVVIFSISVFSRTKLHLLLNILSKGGAHTNSQLRIMKYLFAMANPTAATAHLLMFTLH